MVDLLEKAIEKVKKLPAYEQGQAAELLMGYIDSTHASCPTPQQLAGVEVARDAMRKGSFASEEEVIALKKRHGLI